MTNRHERGLELEAQRLRKSFWVMIAIGILASIIVAMGVKVASGHISTYEGSGRNSVEAWKADNAGWGFYDNVQCRAAD